MPLTLVLHDCFHVSPQLKETLPGEVRQVDTFIFRSWRKYIILLLPHFGGLIFLFWIFFKSAFLIPLMNLISPFIRMHPIWSYGPWKLSTKCLLTKSKQFPSLVSFLPKRKKEKKKTNKKCPAPSVCLWAPDSTLPRLQQPHQGNRGLFFQPNGLSWKSLLRNTRPALIQWEQQRGSCFCLNSY